MSRPAEQADVDRREASKAARRQSIIDAALALARERGRDGFSIDQLAGRAAVSRRTVFNYFGSFNDILLAAHGQVMDVLIADFQTHSRATPVGDGSIASVFDEMVQMLREAELVPPMATLAHLMGDIAADDAAGLRLIREVMHKTAEQLASEVRRRAPEADRLETDLLVHSLLDGLVVINAHWMARTGAVDTAESRAAWDDLFNHLVHTVRDGYRPRPTTQP